MTTRRNQFILSSGRSVLLESLEQWVVYAGLLEGLPTRERNDAELQRLVEEARRHDMHEPVLIPPVQQPIEHEGRYPFGEPAALPSIGCVGRFHSSTPARDESKDCSDLTIIWFQDDYAFPVSPDAERAIVAVEWDKLARDRDY